MSAKMSNGPKKAISERISAFELKKASTVSCTGGGSSSKKTVVSRTYSGKNFSAIKSHFAEVVNSSPQPSSSPSHPQSQSIHTKSGMTVSDLSGHFSNNPSSSPRTPVKVLSSSQKLPNKKSPPTNKSVTNISPVSSQKHQIKRNDVHKATTNNIVMGNTTTTSTPSQNSLPNINVVVDAGEKICPNLNDDVRANDETDSVAMKLDFTGLCVDVNDDVAKNNMKNIQNSNDHYWSKQALRNENARSISEAMKLDLDFNEEKIITLNKELEELHHGENNFEEITSLKRQKHDLEIRFKDQEEELDDLAGQIQLLECAKTKLEMSVVAMKKEHRRELSCKEDELEDARSALQKKVKALEQQLETEHEERIRYARDKRELESKLMNLQEMASHSTDEEIVFRLRKDVKRLKVLLRDAQGIAERSNHETPNRVMLRQLKNQLEDAEFGRNAALKARQNADLELSDVQQQLEEILRSKSDLEDRLQRLNREKADLAGRVEDNEEELSDVMKKYKAAVSQMSVDQITLQEQKSQIIDLEDERTRLREQLTDQSRKIECLEGESVSNLTLHRLTLKVRECEAKLELEMTTRNRLNAQITRLKEFIEKLNGECDSLRLKEQNGQDTGRRLQRQIRELREEFATAQARETEATSKRNEVEKKLELVEAENISTKSDLKLALKRIEELQVAISAEIDSDSALSEDEDGGSDVGREISDYSYDERNDLQSFMENHQRACSIQREREKSLFKDVQPCIPLEGQAAKPVMMIHDSEKGGEETESHA